MEDDPDMQPEPQPAPAHDDEGPYPDLRDPAYVREVLRRRTAILSGQEATIPHEEFMRLAFDEEGNYVLPEDRSAQPRRRS